MHEGHEALQNLKGKDQEIDGSIVKKGMLR
jgi:hypothetical protein